MAETLYLSCVVEGKGEELAIRDLLQRIVFHLSKGRCHVEVPRPVRCSRDRLIQKPEELKRCLELAWLNLGDARKGGRSLILVLVDADDEAPCELGPKILENARENWRKHDMVVALAKREFESWFIAAAESLRGQRGLPQDLIRPQDPEAIRGAKEWLRKQMPRSRTYSPTVDQPALVRLFDIGEAMNHAPSFKRLVMKVAERMELNSSNP